MAKNLPLSPLAPAGLPELHGVEGFQLAVAETGINYQNRPDLMLLVAESEAVVAGALTQSKTASPAVEWCRQVLTSGEKVKAILVNAGNANAFTGKLGEDAVTHKSQFLAEQFSTSPKAILIASTGVIGEPLEAGRITCHLKDMQQSLNANAWGEAAEAIRTTDTFAKAASTKLALDGKEVTITGIAKGSGMIAPDMATMLSFIATDAAINKETLQTITTQAISESFNCITVDSDTSTSDTLIVLASGKAQNSPINSADSEQAKTFAKALTDLMIELALLVVKDGEGASKLITINISGAENDEAARRIGLAIGNSPLVKTAIAGEDANWGRIVMAIGKSGEKAEQDKLSIHIGGIEVAQNGMRTPNYDEAPIAKHMQGSAIDIAVDVGVGNGFAKIWTCDLTHGYIDINANYRS